MTTPTKPTTAIQTTKPDDKEVSFIPFGASDKIRLTAAMIRQFIAVPTKSGQLPSERDSIRFIMLCKGKRANPFEGDCFLIGYDSQNGPSFSMVCGIELFLKRAEQSVHYDGQESGVIVADGENRITERAGALVLKGEKIVGGWAKVYRKDKSHPEYKTVSFDTYNTGRSRWEKDPGGMIAKVALSQALRGAYPTALGGLYTQEEMQRLTEVGQGMIAAQEPIAQPRALGEASQPAASDDGQGTDLAPSTEGKGRKTASHAPRNEGTATQEQEAPQPPASADTVQQQLARFLGEAGVSLDDARDFLGTKGLIADPTSIGSFDEIPSSVCEALQKNTRLIAELVKKFGTPK